MFSSLVRLCVPAFSDACVITVAEELGPRYRIAYPRHHTGADPRPRTTQFDEHELAVRIDSAVDDEPSYRAAIVHVWRAYVPTELDAAIAQMIADRAVGVLRQERLADEATRARESAANLKLALHSNRRIGAAIGVLMATHKLTDSAAFDLLRTASQNSNRKLVEVAEDVVATGWLESSLTRGVVAGRQPGLRA